MGGVMRIANFCNFSNFPLPSLHASISKTVGKRDFPRAVATDSELLPKSSKEFVFIYAVRQRCFRGQGLQGCDRGLQRVQLQALPSA